MLPEEKVKALSEMASRWHLDIPDLISEETVRAALAQRVTQLLGKDPEAFFQLMYRLDISERKLHDALQENDASAAVAGLIWERQWEKLVQRSRNKPPKADDPELQW